MGKQITVKSNKEEECLSEKRSSQEGRHALSEIRRCDLNFQVRNIDLALIRPYKVTEGSSADEGPEIQEKKIIGPEFIFLVIRRLFGCKYPCECS